MSNSPVRSIDREWLFDMLYESRFDRLWEQFCGDADPM